MSILYLQRFSSTISPNIKNLRIISMGIFYQPMKQNMTCFTKQKSTFFSIPTKLWHQIHPQVYLLIIRHLKQGRRPFDMDSNIAKDTLVFSSYNDRFYMMMSVFGVVQALFWMNMASFTYSVGKQYKEVMSSKGKSLSWWEQVMNFVGHNPLKVPIMCMIMAYIMGLFTWVLPQRSVHKLVLLQGGNTVKLTTYTHLARKRTLIIPLQHMSFIQTRMEQGSQLPFKVQKRMGYFMMDKNKGQFHDNELFDYVVGLNRRV